ncbi:MAG: hypothetical protein MI976_14880, partial [Pseudomonadales bacterium]|nr:hypothetical protein [Pseudomonadales bacterium]
SHAKGVLDGFDFHITATGPKLIEVNTNAGGAYLNTSFNQNNHAFEESIWKMFCAEHQLQQASSPLSVIVILDEQPKEQFLYPEMLKFKSLFEKKGVQTFILSPEALRLGRGGLYFQNLKVDLIYNRHTDFYLESAAMEQVKQAFLENQVTLTPNPTAYGYRADKRVLTWFSNPGFLDALGLSDHELSFIRQVVPETHLVTSENAEQFWRERKKWFFKPVSGFGSRGVYRGSKLTKNTWQKIVGTGSYKTNNRAGNYVAQSFVPPAKRVVAVDGKEQLLKSDVRHYVYDGSILMSLSRLYHGQATNLRTQGGGFSPLMVL